jgi:hypothetical protein
MLGHEGGGFEEELIRQEKTTTWLEMLDKIERVCDMRGFPIDANIRETVVALNLSGITTSASCEGHSDRGRGAPWITVEAQGRPRERFVGEDEIFQRTAQKYRASEQEVRKGQNHEAWKEATNLAVANGETQEYQAWRKQGQLLLDKVRTTLEEFYQGRFVESGALLEVASNAEGSFNIHNGRDDYERKSPTLTEDERRALTGRLAGYQREMKAFTDFLKEKYYSSSL